MRHLTAEHFLQGLGGKVMEINGCKCVLNMPVAWRSHDEKGNKIDYGRQLPPYDEQHAFMVDHFDAACPQTWMRGSAKETSYFVPVLPEHGLWLDFEGNNHHSHHMAALISVQGLNSETAMPTEGAFHLEQYRNECPKHNVPFGAERFCKECGFKWPYQNYLATTTGTRFWTDGFRTQEGKKEQFVFTEKVIRGIAAQLLGDKRVFAIGIAFYLSKEPKPLPPPSPVRYRGGGIDKKAYFGGGMFKNTDASYDFFGAQSKGLTASLGDDGPQLTSLKGEPEVACRRIAQVVGSASPPSPMPLAAQMLRGISGGHRAPVARVQPKKNFEIAGGAKISQDAGRDPNDIGFWQEEPAGILYINYADLATVREILAHGKEDRTAHGEGPLAGLVTGHYPGVGDNH